MVKRRLELWIENWFVRSMVVEEVGVDDGELVCWIDGRNGSWSCGCRVSLDQ